MARAKPAALTSLVSTARYAIGTSSAKIAPLVGSSKRTVDRWFAGESHPSDAQVVKIARLVHPRNPALAAQLAAAVGETLVTLGLVQVRPPPAHAHLIDAVVCVAAETINVPSLALRPALLAAFQRARELGFTLEDAEKALAAGATAAARA
jgi:hypothetical protein